MTAAAATSAASSSAGSLGNPSSAAKPCTTGPAPRTVNPASPPALTSSSRVELHGGAACIYHVLSEVTIETHHAPPADHDRLRRPPRPTRQRPPAPRAYGTFPASSVITFATAKCSPSASPLQDDQANLPSALGSHPTAACSSRSAPSPISPSSIPPTVAAEEHLRREPPIPRRHPLRCRQRPGRLRSFRLPRRPRRPHSAQRELRAGASAVEVGGLRPPPRATRAPPVSPPISPRPSAEKIKFLSALAA